jgi:drug/metabolite transporter (DMT)-like permease
MTISTGDVLKLHGLVFLFGFTGILGKLVSIPALDMVLYRTLIAATGIALVLLYTKGSFRVSRPDVLRLLLTGSVVGIHWLTFFLAARVSNVSVSLVGFATASLWTALLEPLVKRYPLRYIEVIFGFVVLGGLSIIFALDSNYATGLLLGVVSGLTCAIFSVVNSLMVKRISANAITLYEMVGAGLLTAAFIPCYAYFTGEHSGMPMLPAGWDWLWIFLLGGLCTVYAYSAAVELMKRLSVFFFQLTLNLEPIYGIIMAVIIFGDAERMDFNFYLGTLIILCAVLVYPYTRRRFTANPTNTTHM